MSPLEQNFCDIQIVIITNVVVVSSVSIKRVGCSNIDFFKCQDKYSKKLRCPNP